MINMINHQTTVSEAEGLPATRTRASTGPTLSGGPCTSSDPLFGSSPGMMRRMSSIAGGGGVGSSGGFGGGSLPAASIDMSDLNNLVSEGENMVVVVVVMVALAAVAVVAFACLQKRNRTINRVEWSRRGVLLLSF